jgi:pilus assembly protein FimV
MMKSKLATAIALVGLMHSSVLFALGLGDIKVSSAVNERLDAEIPLVNAEGLDASQILVSLASKADFARAEVDRDYFLSSLEFTVERGESGTPILRLQTPDVVLEPYLNFLVELRWPKGRLLREYTVLLDLPNYSAAPARIISPAAASVPPDREKTKPFVRSFVPASKAPSAAPSSSSRSTNDKADSQAESAVTVRANETLWSIAKRVREEGASINQTMLALQDINPNAFINNNINLLKKGAVLRLPLGMSANRVNEQAAQQSIAEQQSDWQSGINTDLNPTLDARESTQTLASSPEASEGHLQLATVGDSSSSNVLINNDSDANGVAENASGQAGNVEIDRLRNELAISLENLDRAAVENTTMDTRLAAMESQLGDLEQLVSLKDQELASMRVAIEERKAILKDAAPNAESLNAGALDMAQDTAQDTPKTNAPAVEVGRLEAMANALSISVEWLVGISIAFVAAVITIFMWFFARREDAYEATVFERVEPLADEDENESFDEDYEAEEESVDVAVGENGDVDLDSLDLDSHDLDDSDIDESIITAASEREADAFNDDFDGNVTAIDKAGEDFDTERDVIAEADIYLAYGRYEQAREMLDGAIEDESERIDLQLKRLELFVAQQSPDLFRNACQVLLAIDPNVNVAAEALLKDVENISDWWPEDTVSSPTDELLESYTHDDALADSVEDEEGKGDFGLQLAYDADSEGKPAEAVEPARENDEVGTKLDLARAYIDMGDLEGAREILDEVMSEGSDEQRDLANSMMGKFAS